MKLQMASRGAAARALPVVAAAALSLAAATLAPAPGAGAARALVLGGAAARALIVPAALAAAAVGAPARAAPAEARALEGRAEAAHARALPEYRRALQVWRRLQAAARGDGAAEARAREALVRLAVKMRELGEIERLRVRAPGATPLLATGAAGGPAPGDLERLADVLALARRDAPRLPEHEPRDLPLIDETLALAREALADLRELEADRLHAAALEAWRSVPLSDPERRLAEVRLRYRLRQLEEAWKSAREHPVRRDEVSPQDYEEHLELLLTLARLLGDGASAKHLEEELFALRGRAPEAPRALARFAGLPLRSQAELARTASTLAGLSRHFRLSARGRALCALFAAASTLELGEFGAAAGILEPAVEALERAPAHERDPWLEVSLLGRLGLARDETGDYEGALRAYRRAAARLGEAGETRTFAWRLELNTARALLGLGKLAETKVTARRVLLEKEAPLHLRVRARLLLGAAVFEEARARPERLGEAREVFATAEREIRQGEDTLPDLLELQAAVAVHLGNTLFLEARGAAAEERAVKLKEAARIQYTAYSACSKASLERLAALAAANLGEIYLESGNLAAARQAIAWALEAARREHLFETEWRCHWYLGRLADLEGDGAAAERELGRAVEIVESYRARILDAETKSGFMSNKIDLYRDLVAREIARGRPERALDLAERARARALVESLGWRFVSLADPEETSLYRELVSLMAQEARSRDSRVARFFGVEARRLDYEKLRERLEELRRRLAGAPELSAALKALVNGAPATSDEILRELGERTLVEYFALRDSLVALVAARGTVRAVPLGADGRGLEEKVRRFLAAGAADAALARELHDLLVAPLRGILGSQRLTIVPYGPLHWLPFEALRGPRGELVEELEISYLPSASVLKYLRWNERVARGGGERRLLALADPDTDYNGDGERDLVALESAREEAGRIAENFKSSEVLVDKLACESSLYTQARGAEVVHLACHGEFYPSRPWDSTLFLARGPGEAPSGSRLPCGGDGFLRAFEVFALDLRGNRLVALSGCQTGVQEVTEGDDPAGIATAFLHSGAGSLLVSLWKVEDAATAELMRAFYRHWIVEAKDRIAALREAKLEVRRRYPAPRQWAAFILIGTGSEL